MGGGWYQAPADGHPPPGDAEAGDGAEVNNYLPPVRGRPALAPGGDVGSLAFARWGLQRCPQPSEPLLTCLGRPFCAPTPPSRSGPRTGPGDSPGHSPQPLQMFRRFPPSLPHDSPRWRATSSSSRPPPRPRRSAPASSTRSSRTTSSSRPREGGRCGDLIPRCRPTTVPSRHPPCDSLTPPGGRRGSRAGQRRRARARG